MNEIKTIIFSKDRACQLELLLRNLNMPATILFTHETDFQKGYEKLMRMYPQFTFIKENNFKQQIIKLIDNNEYVMFLCDDDIMIEHFNENCPEFKEFKNNPEILCLSLRIKPTYRYVPILQDNKWEWKGKRKDWGYPMSVTSHIFRSADILSIITKENFKTPGGLEMKLRRNAPERKLMMCLDTPKIINNLANRVQNKYPTPNNLGIPLEELEQKFLEGKLLSLKDIQEKAKNAISCFLITPYKWENNWLNSHKKNIHSQRGEDGIIEKVFELLSVKSGLCVDVGAFGILMSNTHNLIKKGWEGILIEKDKDKITNLKQIHRKHNVICIQETITPNGKKKLDNLLSEYISQKEFDFLTIDIDGNDYYLWESLSLFKPPLVVIEFNPTFDFDDYLQHIDGEGGASLSKMVELGKSKGYELIATTEINAFFIRKDLFKKFDISNNSIEELFIKNKATYGRKTRKDIEK